MASAAGLSWFSAIVNGTAAGTGPDSVTQQVGGEGLAITLYTDVGTGSYTLTFNKVIDPTEYMVLVWNQTAAAAGVLATWSVATDVLTVKTFDTDGKTAADAIFGVLLIPLKS
jgi:hypothetical protein